MTEDDFDEGEQLYITFHCDLKFVRVVGPALLPTNLSFKCDVTPEEDAEEQDLHKVLTKVRYWLDNIVNKSLVFSSDNTEALTMFVNEEGKNRTDNILMITPGDPSDEMMACLLQSKLTALGGGTMTFGMMEVKSDNYLGLGFAFMGDGHKVLPTIEEWIGPRSFFKVPWWMRNDASTLDVVPPADADLTKTPAWAFSLDNLVSPKTDGGIVIKHEFKPTVIDGGKPEK